MSNKQVPVLIADVGGTHARLAVTAGLGAYDHLAILDTCRFRSFDEVVETYLEDLAERPVQAAIAAAGPVDGGGVTLTNLDWRISQTGLRAKFGFEQVNLLNDFTANGLALGLLSDKDLLPIGAGGIDPAMPALVIGPGTGLGLAIVVPTAAGPQVIATEGGHVTLASSNDLERAVIQELHGQFGHVSAERVLSGTGIETLYRVLAHLQGEPADAMSAAEISADAETDPLAADTMAQFFAFLGGFAGDAALTAGAKGGVYLMGGILPKLAGALNASSFRERFEAKGRFQEYLKPISTMVVCHENPALLGLTRLAAEIA